MINQLSFETPMLPSIDHAKIVIQKIKEGDIVLRPSKNTKLDRLVLEGFKQRHAWFFNDEKFSHNQKMEYLYQLANSMLNDKTIQRGYMQ
jgi:hypothetical protein